MSDPLAPPPRRPMPEELQRRITRELSAATASRRRLGSVVIPLVAAALVATMVAVGVTTFRDRQQVGPAETASPVPPTASPTAAPRPTPSTTGTPTPAPRPASLDVRPMTKAEIAADTETCLRPIEGAEAIPRQGRLRVQLAVVERLAGPDGVGASSLRVLLLQDGAGYVNCSDGQRDSWTRGERLPAPATSRVPVVDVGSGGSSASCGPGSGTVDTNGLFRVHRSVRTARVRVLRQAKPPGPWSTTTPVEGLAYLPVRLTGSVVRERGMQVEYAFLDEEGRTLPIDWGTDKPTRSLVLELTTCGDVDARRGRIKAPVRPSSDASGLQTCEAMVEEAVEHQDVEARGDWKSRLLVSTENEWGAVLSDGRNLVGCSLFPTTEISPFIPDTPVLRKSAFFFAVNPIGDTGAVSLWAAGRVPTDVTGITYRLPGDREVAATIDDRGYWMLKHHTAAGEDIGSEERSQDWPPVVVTVTRSSGTQRYSIAFGEETMCRQVSHGC